MVMRSSAFRPSLRRQGSSADWTPKAAPPSAALRDQQNPLETRSKELVAVGTVGLSRRLVLAAMGHEKCKASTFPCIFARGQKYRIQKVSDLSGDGLFLQRASGRTFRHARRSRSTVPVRLHRRQRDAPRRPRLRSRVAARTKMGKASAEHPLFLAARYSALARRSKPLERARSIDLPESLT